MQIEAPISKVIQTSNDKQRDEKNRLLGRGLVAKWVFHLLSLPRLLDRIPTGATPLKLFPGSRRRFGDLKSTFSERRQRRLLWFVIVELKPERGDQGQQFSTADGTNLMYH
jgi:hypothetical protein